MCQYSTNKVLNFLNKNKMHWKRHILTITDKKIQKLKNKTK